MRHAGSPYRLGAALIAALLVSACGGDDDTSATTEPSAPSSAPSSTNEPAATVSVDVYLVDQEAFNVGTAPYVVALERQVPAEDPITGALDALFAGPTTDEANDGIILVASGATGVSEVTLEDGIARVPAPRRRMQQWGVHSQRRRRDHPDAAAVRRGRCREDLRPRGHDR